MNLYQYLSQFQILVLLKNNLDRLELEFFKMRQVVRREVRKILPNRKSDSYKFAILCVKRTAYVYLAIQNINSLHFFNSTHLVTLYVDQPCLSAFKKMRGKLHYPTKVRPTLFIKSKNQPWQLSKIDVLIEASKKDQILTDADGIWRADPKISSEKVTLLVPAYPFRSNKLEKKLLASLNPSKKWLMYTHFVTGFVSIPSRFMTAQLARDCQAISKKIFSRKFPFSHTKAEADVLARLAEEIAVSIAIQKNVDTNNITTLKLSDGPSDRKILQSMYYGCTYKILE